MNPPSEFGIPPAALCATVLPNDLRSAKHFEQMVLAEVARQLYSAESVFAIKLALEEALTNAIKHGNRNDVSKSLHLRFHVDSQRVVIGVRDEGAGFEPDLLPDPTSDENLERPNGRGIMLIRAYMTRVHYADRGNELWMMKRNGDA